jgi:uncharacterized protein involved in tolerance to divalent cations
MINLIIYLEQATDAHALVNELLSKKMVASASIDSDNAYFTVINGKVTKTIHTVITAQTKASLFSSISDYILERHDKDTPIFSMPITQSNDNFAEDIRAKTKTIA